MKRYVKTFFSDGSETIFDMEFHALASVMMKRIKERAKAEKIRRKVVNWHFVDFE